MVLLCPKKTQLDPPTSLSGLLDLKETGTTSVNTQWELHKERQLNVVNAAGGLRGAWLFLLFSA